MVRKYEHEATTSEVEDEPRAWRDQVKKKTLDLRDLATCLPVPTGEVGDPDWQKHKRWDDTSDDSVRIPRKNGKRRAIEEDVENSGQSTEEYEEAEQEPQPKMKSKAKANVSAKRKGEIEQKPNAASQAKTRANRKAATTKKIYSYSFDEDIDNIDEYKLYGNDQGNGSDDEYIPSTRRGKKDATKGRGMAKSKATKTVDPSPTDISEDRNLVKVVFRSNGIVMNPGNEMDCAEDNQSADRVVRDKSDSDESKSLFVSQDSNDADKAKAPAAAGLIDIDAQVGIKQEKVTPDHENPAAATQGGYFHDFDVGVSQELSATTSITGSKRRASTSPPAASHDQYPTKRRPKKSNDPFGLLMDVDMDDSDFTLPHN